MEPQKPKDPFANEIPENVLCVVEQLRAENEALLQSNRELERFASLASHDLRAPLCVISSSLSLLQHRYGDRFDKDARNYLSYATDGAKRCLQLIDDLLTFARCGSETAPFEAVNCNLAVDVSKENLAAAFFEAKGELVIDTLPSVEGDESQLTQVFQNLISNAIKYCRKNVPPRVHVSCVTEEGAFRFSVRDNGIGIPKESQEAVFSPFNRLHGREDYEGTGVGLALCKKIIERHGGRIWVSSETNEGSEFNFTIAQRKSQGEERERPSRR